MDLGKLEELLAAESYPHRYIHKFIGRKTPAFLAGVQELELRFKRAARTGSRETSDSRGGPYLALTYELLAQQPAEIIALIKATGALPDLKIIL